MGKLTSKRVSVVHESGGALGAPDAAGTGGGHGWAEQRVLSRRTLGDFLSKPWTETAIPVLLLVILTAVLSITLDRFMTTGNMLGILQQVAEMGFIVLGMTLVVIVGGIDLSIGAIYAITNFTALYLIQYMGWPAPLAILATLAVGGALGAFNGVLIGLFRLRAFLTTLISLMIFRGIYDILVLKFGAGVAAGLPNSLIWDYFGFGSTLGLSPSIWIFTVLAVMFHVFLTRFRAGWHVYAIGGSKRAAYNAGVPVRRTVMLCYVASGALTALSAVFFAARFGTTSYDVGIGLEFIILTAVVVGGIALGGGKGSVSKAVVGLLIVLFLVNGLTSMSLPAGVVNLSLGIVLILAAVLDIAWNRNRNRLFGSAAPVSNGDPAMLNLSVAPVKSRTPT